MRCTLYAVGVLLAGSSPLAAQVDQSSAVVPPVTSELKPVIASEIKSEVNVAPAPVTGNSSLSCPSDKNGLTDGWQVFAYTLDRNAAVSLNLYASADLAASDKVILYHYIWYKDLTNDDGKLIARCGAGVSLSLKASKLTAETKLNLPSLAASTQLGLTEVEYKLGTFGISGSAIDNAAPPAGLVGRFDANSYAALISAIDKVQAAGKATDATVKFTPKLVAIPSSTPSSATRNMLIQVSALRHIARGWTCSKSKASIAARDSNTDDLVDQFYRSYTRPLVCNAIGGGPRDSDKAKAKNELATYGISVN